MGRTDEERRGHVLLLGALALLLGLVVSLKLLVGGGDGAGVLPRDAREDSTGLAPADGRSVEPRAAPERALAAAAPGETGADPQRSAVRADGPEPRAWSGRVKARRSGLPLAGARVALCEGSRRLEAETDVDGRFELAWTGGDAPDAEVWREGYAPLQRPHLDLGAPALFELEAAGAIVGLVRGPSPPELAAGRALLWDLGVDRGARREPLELGLEKSGSFVFEGLAAGQYSVGVSVPGWSLAFESGLQIDPGERTDIALDPARGALLRGVVRTKGDRRPVAGAELAVGPELQGVSSVVEDFGRVSAITGEDGGFTLTGLSVGENRLTVETAWGGRLQQRVSVTEPGQLLDPLELYLDAPASLAGKVVSEAGHGVSGARVHVAWEGRAFSADPDRGVKDHEGLLRADCDVNGRFRFESLPAGRPLELVALRGDEELPPPALRAKLFGRREGLVLKGGEEREDFELLVRETIALEGVVRDVEGRGVDDARLEARRLGRGGQEDWSEGRSDATGEFELLGLLPGRYRVVVKHDDYLPAYTTVNVDPELAPVPLELELEAAWRISGWVVDEWGNGVPHARVRGEAPDLAEAPGGKGPSAQTRTEDFGRFTLERLREGPWLVRADAVGYERSEPVVALAPGDTALELMLVEKPPLERVAVFGVAVMPDGSAPPGLVVSDPRGGSLTREGTDFRLSGARAGRLRFELRADGCVPVPFGPLDLAPGAEHDLGLVQLEPAASLTVYVRSEAQGGRALGRFKAVLTPLPPAQGGPGGKPVGLILRVEPHAWEPGGKKVETIAASARAVPHGRYRLSISHRACARYEKTLELGANRPRRTMEVVLEPRTKGKQGAAGKPPKPVKQGKPGRKR